MFFPSGSASGDVRWCSSLALGSLFETTSDLPSVADSFSHSAMSSRGDATQRAGGWRGVGLPEQECSCNMGMTQHRDLGGCSLRSLPRAPVSSLSSSVSSPLYPPFAGTQGKWLQMKIYVSVL